MRECPIVPLSCYRPKTGSICPSGETKKKGNLRAAPLKIPLIVQSCYAQSKTIGLSLPKLRVALCAMKLYETGKGQQVGATNGRPRLRRVLPCCVDIKFRCATEPSPRGEGGPRQRWMRCAHAEGMGECAVTNSVDVTSSATLITQHKISPHQNRSLRLRLLRRRHQRCGRMRTDKCG